MIGALHVDVAWSIMRNVLPASTQFVCKGREQRPELLTGNVRFRPGLEGQQLALAIESCISPQLKFYAASLHDQPDVAQGREVGQRVAADDQDVRCQAWLQAAGLMRNVDDLRGIAGR